MTLDELRIRVLNDAGAWTLLQADCALEYPEGAVRAVRQRLDSAWESVEDLTYALRGEGKDAAEIEAIISADTARMDELLAEDARRAAKEARRDEDAEEVAA